MKGSNPGEFEELILLSVAKLFDEAYGVAIQDELRSFGRSVSLPTIHVALIRLEKKGWLDSRFDGATNQRGGRRKHLYRLTAAGHKAIARSRESREALWKSIPKAAFKFN
jgi:PadR family transcriptional regulator, regulatory protein PadR